MHLSAGKALVRAYLDMIGEAFEQGKDHRLRAWFGLGAVGHLDHQSGTRVVHEHRDRIVAIRSLAPSHGPRTGLADGQAQFFQPFDQPGPPRHGHGHQSRRADVFGGRGEP
ncbi:hypothetical protein GCM10027456_48690 [Kineosporia babensis]